MTWLPTKGRKKTKKAKPRAKKTAMATTYEHRRKGSGYKEKEKQMNNFGDNKR